MQQLQRKQTGFTLIELVVVIVILGILAATAIPRFADMSVQAKQATRSGVEGAVRSANAIAHAQALVNDVDTSLGPGAGATVDLEGQTIDLAYGYPRGSTTGILLAVDTDVSSSCTTGTCTWTVDADANCTVTFTEADSDGDTPDFGGTETCDG